MSEARGLPGDSWRWNTRHHPTPRMTSISVIEPPSDELDEHPEAARRVPFGFGIRDPEPPAEPGEPLLWDGDGA